MTALPTDIENNFIPLLSLQTSNVEIKTVGKIDRKDVCIFILRRLPKGSYSLFYVGYYQRPADWYLPDRDPPVHDVVNLYQQRLYL